MHQLQIHGMEVVRTVMRCGAKMDYKTGIDLNPVMVIASRRYG